MATTPTRRVGRTPVRLPGALRERSGPGAPPDPVSPGVADGVVSVALHAAWATSAAAAALDGLLRPRRTARVRAALIRSGFQPWKTLRRIWFARICREVLWGLGRMGCREAVGRRVRVEGNLAALGSSCVLAAYHSDWWRLAAIRIRPAMRLALLAGTRWSIRLPRVRVLDPEATPRQLLEHLTKGGSCGLTVDHLRPDGAYARGELLGRAVRVPLTAARLASRARVSLVPVSLRWSQGRIVVSLGPEIRGGASPEEAMATALRWLSGAIDADPSSWAGVHRFLGGAKPGDRRDGAGEGSEGRPGGRRTDRPPRGTGS